MAKEKRTKPCSNCKKSKVKCEYHHGLPCVRCVNNGLGHSCQFVVKLPSLSLPSIPSSHLPPSYKLPPKDAQTPALPSIDQTYPSNSYPINQVNHLPSNVTPKSATTPIGPNHGLPQPQAHELHWKSSMESKLNSVNAKFDNIMNALTANQEALAAERALNQQYLAQNLSLQGQMAKQSASMASNPQSRIMAEYDPKEANRKRHLNDEHFISQKRTKQDRNSDFRDKVISLEEAKVLFEFFDANIAQQLFGFDIKKFTVDTIWHSSPILVCAICTIASIHYPDPAIASKRELLQQHLQEMCGSLLVKGKPRTELEAFNTIVSLILCSFWLSNSQMFTGLALQLAKEFHLNSPHSAANPSNTLSDSDRLKLWYLLYILDGQQSMTFNRQALVSSDDYSLQNTRKLLLENSPTEAIENKKTNSSSETNGQIAAPETYNKLTDLRLVSQVEYNIALSESFKGHAWDLLNPSAFGIPSRSNLELDKWMVSWTVLLAPADNGTVWSSKSTLIYYNFAKMHINSSVIRQLQGSDGHEDEILPNWKNYKALADGDLQCTAQASVSTSKDANTDDSDEDEDDNDEEFVMHSALATQDQTLVNLKIAINAAQTVLNLVLSDPDISNNLKYVPVHIHIMLYYAAILLVSSPTIASYGNSDNADYFHDVIGRLKTVKSLQKKVYNNLPTDRAFGNSVIENLENLFEERLRKLKTELGDSMLQVSSKADIMNEISTLHITWGKVDSLPDSNEGSSLDSSPRPERISAWPGSHHGHP